jgi:hypothetical protein
MDTKPSYVRVIVDDHDSSSGTYKNWTPQKKIKKIKVVVLRNTTYPATHSSSLSSKVLSD